MVPFASYVSRGQSKPRLTFSRINGPNIIQISVYFNTELLRLTAWLHKGP